MQEQIEKSGMNKGESIVFSWRVEEFYQLLESCKVDDEVSFTIKYLKDKDLKILEAGCGLGRVVKYLSDLGFKNVEGIELNQETVSFLNFNFPELKISCADLLNLSYPKNSFDIVLSYGVIEHFPAGPDAPLKVMYDLIKPGGLAIITVPSFNIIRKINYFFSKIDPRKNNLIRKLFGKQLLIKNNKRFSYYIEPQIGNFFEYRFTKKQFENICKNAGFTILESTPIAHIDGLFHIFGSKFVTFKNWQFNVSRIGKILNKVLIKIPFLHNHMHVCIVKKS